MSTGAPPPAVEAGTGLSGWTRVAAPTPLSAAEEGAPATLELARRFNPAMAFPTRDIWPTSVSYAWHDRPDLMARVVGGTGRVVREYVALGGATLDQAWGKLPEIDGNGDKVEYYVDAPGDDRDQDGKMGWLTRWRSIMGAPREVTATAYPPTQYAHVFWFNRAQGLLAIQYWFYYPYDSWINRHEGDWEHINVIVKGPPQLTDAAAFSPVGVQFFFHGLMYEPQRAAFTGEGGDHVMVFSGGSSRLFFWQGDVSGGSYPFPAYYPGAGGHAGPLTPGDDTRNPKRFVKAEDFRVVYLPEPERLDVARRPELSWLRLPFFAGQLRVYGNPFVLDWMDRGGAPPQPGRRRDWNAGSPSPQWSGAVRTHRRLSLPAGWQARIARLDPRAIATPKNPAPNENALVGLP